MRRQTRTATRATTSGLLGGAGGRSSLPIPAWQVPRLCLEVGVSPQAQSWRVNASQSVGALSSKACPLGVSGLDIWTWGLSPPTYLPAAQPWCWAAPSPLPSSPLPRPLPGGSGVTVLFPWAAERLCTLHPARRASEGGDRRKCCQYTVRWKAECEVECRVGSWFCFKKCTDAQVGSEAHTPYSIFSFTLF